MPHYVEYSTNNTEKLDSSHIHHERTQAEELAQFGALVDLINRGSKWSYYWTPEGRPYTDQAGNVITGKESLWHPTGRQLRPPADWIQHRNVYFGVAGTEAPRKQSQRTTNDTAAALGAFFADIDAKDYVHEDEWRPFYQLPEITAEMSEAKARGALVRAQNRAIDAACKADLEQYRARALAHVLAAPLRASAVWDTGGGYHCVWLLDQPIILDDTTRPIARHLEREWVHSLGADPAATDFARVLRVPGTYNRKPKYAPDFPLVRFLWCDLDSRYTVAQFAALLPEAPTPRQPRETFIPQGLPLDLSTVGSVPRLPRHGALEAYNTRTDLRTLLLEIGYEAASTPHRLSRPGGDTAGVELHPDNTASVYSSADPLYCGRRITPADALCVYQYGGRGDDMLDVLTGGAWRGAEHTLAAVAAYIHEINLHERLAVEHYRARERDLAVADALIEVMQERRAFSVLVSWRQLRKLVNAGSVSRIAQALANLRAAGIITQVDAETGEITNRITLTPAFLAEVKTVVRKRITPSEDSDLLYEEGDPFTHKTFRDHRADDAFIAAMTPITDEMAETNGYSEHYTLTRVYQRRRHATAASLGRGALFVLDRLVGAGGAIEVADLVGIAGRSRFTIRRNVDRLVDAGIVLDDGRGLLTLRQGGRISESVVLPDWRNKLDELRPQMPTAGTGRRRIVKEAYTTLDQCDAQEAAAAATGQPAPSWLGKRRDQAGDVLKRYAPELWVLRSTAARRASFFNGDGTLQRRFGRNRQTLAEQLLILANKELLTADEADRMQALSAKLGMPVETVRVEFSL